MAQRNDGVFQLSLTEIAFTLAFILLLLLGRLVVAEQKKRASAEDALAKVQSFERAMADLDAAKSTFLVNLRSEGVRNPEDVITKLIEVEEVRGERDLLRQQVHDLDAKLTALEELQEHLEKVAQATRPTITRDEVSAALAFQGQVRKAFEDAEGSLPHQTRQSASPMARKETLEKIKRAITATGALNTQLKAQLNKDLIPGQESQTVRDVVAAAKGYAELAKTGVNPEQVKKESADLRGQVAFLKNRLDARGGRDYPPCWADETGKVEFLFAVEVKPDSVVVNPAWPPRREAAARALPGIDDILAGPHSNQTFISRIQGIFNWTESQDPKCRHYVQLKSSIPDAVQSDRARLMVEGYFYKSEVRR